MLGSVYYALGSISSAKIVQSGEIHIAILSVATSCVQDVINEQIDYETKTKMKIEKRVTKESSIHS